MIHCLRRIYLLVVLFSLLFTIVMPVFAQWEFLDPPGAQIRNTIQALAEVKIDHTSLLLAATNDGIFLDPGGATTKAQWIDISYGIPPGSRDICSIVTFDSVIVIASKDGSVLYTVLSPRFFSGTPFFEWKKLGTGLSVNTVFALQRHKSVLYAATNSGVWMLPVNNTNEPSQSSLGKKKPQWQPVGQRFVFETNTLLVHDNILYSAVRGGGLFWYNLECSLCDWNMIPLPVEIARTGIRALAWISHEKTFETPNYSIPLRCSGIVVAPEASEHLFLGITISGEKQKIEWLNISPRNTKEEFSSPVTTIINNSGVYGKEMIMVGTDSRGILATPDCGQTWLPLHGTSSSNLSQSSVQTLYGNETHILAGIQQNSTKTTNIASLTAGRGLPRDIIADASQFTSDTSRKDNRMSITADVGTERGTVIVNLGESQYIEVMAYNLLGKKVLDIYSGDAKSGSNSISFNMSSLSNGLYICVVRGKTFKLAEKFLVSR